LALNLLMIQGFLFSFFYGYAALHAGV